MSGFKSFEIIPGDASQSLVILADHATNHLPAEYGTLGLPQEALARHIAYDIGVEALTRGLCAKLNVPAVMSCFSRLLIDPNRGEHDPTLIMKLSDAAVIPGNHPLSPQEREHRLNAYHRPYHAAVAATIAKTTNESGKPPLVISMHSYTPIWKEFVRPWHAGVLWDSDPRAACAMIELLCQDTSLMVGDNEPYDGALKGDTMHRHCTTQGLAHALLEIRQDLIGDETGIKSWINRLVPVFTALAKRPEMHEIRHYGSRTIS